MFYIFLDTSYLIEFIQADLESTSKVSRWKKLLELLRSEISRGEILCPMSEFPTQEALLSERLLSEFISLQIELSKDSCFRSWEEILIHQVATKVCLELGRPQDIDKNWSVVIPGSPRVIHPWATARIKANMKTYAETVRPLREKYGSFRKYEEHYEAEIKDFLKATFLNVFSELPARLIMEAKIYESEIYPLITLLQDPKFMGNVPFINVFCSLMASNTFHERYRKDKESDVLDIVALASVIPYCKIVTTDRNMKAMLYRINLDKLYEVQAYAPILKDLDGFTKTLSALTS